MNCCKAVLTWAVRKKGINDPTQQARSWSARLGAVAAENAASQLATRLAAILDHLRRRQEARQDAHDKLRAHLLIRS
jgi:hypothetical protein